MDNGSGGNVTKVKMSGYLNLKIKKKAANSEEQKKWMQVILAALNQNQNFNPDRPKHLNHFRYSLDDLVPEVEEVAPKSGLERQNTMPYRVEKESNEIIERLQKIGAQSYGGSLGAITKIAAKKGVPHTRISLHETRFYDDDIFRRRNNSNRIYERISGESQDSNALYDRITSNMEAPNRVSFLVDNENYSTPILKREIKSLIIENEQYGTTRHVNSDEVIYSEPKLQDFNRNNVSVENSFYASADIVSRNSEDENLYEDLEQYNTQPGIAPSPTLEPLEIPTEPKMKKSKSFIRRVWKRKNTAKKEATSEEEIYAEIDPVVVEKTSVTDNGAIKMLSELQNILEKQKVKIKPQSTDSKSDPEPPKTSKSAEESKESDPDCPILPPKTRKNSHEQVRSLDEILEDLEQEKTETKTNVQKLIEKFEPDEVILRKSQESKGGNRHSDDLNQLLNELLKVTTAPIMTPGVTSSLGNSNLTDEEWLKILPLKQRRLSEPDYDIPRSHKSLTLTENKETDIIPGTGLFGRASSAHLSDYKEDTSVDMTPDSLEVEQSTKFDNLHSYTSHNYVVSDSADSSEIIYALPKSYVSVATHVVNTCQNFCGAPFNDDCTIIYKSVKNVDLQDEIFNDSLECCEETKTEF